MAQILVIEDEDALRQILVDELQEAGHTVRHAIDGADGLAAILAQRPDLVVSDITMPNMTGLELLRTLRADHQGFGDLPFVFLSALSDKEAVLTGLSLGADDYVTKPCDFDILLGKVNSRLRQMDRIGAKKEAEMVRLYKAMTVQATSEEAEQPVDPAARRAAAKAKLLQAVAEATTKSKN